MSWRDHAAPIIRRVLQAMRGKPEKEIRAALREAYPYGLRKHHPYKIWCDEIARQRGKKAALRDPNPRNPNQLALPAPASSP